MQKTIFIMQKNNCLILIVDFGRHSEKFEKILQSLGVKAKIVLPNASTSLLKKSDGIILTGSKASVYNKTAPKYNKKIFSTGKPVLGVCYGHQLMAHALGGRVEKMKKTINKKRKLEITKKSVLFKKVGKAPIVWMSHGDAVTRLPKGFKSTAQTTETQNAAMECKEKNLFGIQFHPENKKTVKGKEFLKNFVLTACSAKN